MSKNGKEPNFKKAFQSFSDNVSKAARFKANNDEFSVLAEMKTSSVVSVIVIYIEKKLN